MATTTGGTTYVTSTDLVANYPTASLALANRVDVVASGGPNSIKTSGYTITLADILGGNKFLYNSASPGTFTLPTSGLVDGMVVNVAQIGAAALTVSGGTIVGTTATTAQYQSLQFVYASTGTTWYSVAPPATAPGLAIVTPTSIANSGGTATATGGQIACAGVTSVSLNGVFTSTYENYRIVVYGKSTTGVALFARLRLSGTDASGSNYTYLEQYVNSAGGPTRSYTASQTNGVLGVVGANYSCISTEICGPQIAQYTPWTAMSMRDDALVNTGIVHQLATSYDGITIYPNSSTFTGNIRVYGYKNS
jgi:hypothetical protein